MERRLARRNFEFASIFPVRVVQRLVRSKQGLCGFLRKENVIVLGTGVVKKEYA